MKILLRHLLLLGAIIGLLWQSVANASPLCFEMQQEPSVAVAGLADCMDTDKQLKPDSEPRKVTPAVCMAMVGCASLTALEAMSVATAMHSDLAEVASWSASPILLGRTEAPIPEPPTIIG